jgi:hypothetical protein
MIPVHAAAVRNIKNAVAVMRNFLPVALVNDLLKSKFVN